MEQKNNDNLKAQIENAAKQLTAVDVFKSLNPNQKWLVGWMSRTSLQKGRVLGQMEKEGKTAAEIAKRLHVTEKMVQDALNERPEDVLVLMENGGEDIVVETEVRTETVKNDCSGDGKTATDVSDDAKPESVKDILKEL